MVGTLQPQHWLLAFGIHCDSHSRHQRLYLLCTHTTLVTSVPNSICVCVGAARVQDAQDWRRRDSPLDGTASSPGGGFVSDEGSPGAHKQPLDISFSVLLWSVSSAWFFVVLRVYCLHLLIILALSLEFSQGFWSLVVGSTFLLSLGLLYYYFRFPKSVSWIFGWDVNLCFLAVGCTLVLSCVCWDRKKEDKLH